MTCGVYKLTFNSGMIYIGKSIDIETRWKQHWDKLRSGKGAVKMQREFDNYGFPETRIIYDCHEDHIDFIEACFINSYPRSSMLNGTFPAALALKDINLINEQHSAFQASTFDHVRALLQYAYRERDLEDKIEELKKK